MLTTFVFLCFSLLIATGITEEQAECTKELFSDALIKARSALPRTPHVLVTGAGGFIASHIADYCLLHLNFTVVAVDDLSGGFMSNVDVFRSRGGVFVKGDLQSITFVHHLFRMHGPFDHVYHIAAYAAEGLSHFIRHYNYRNNLLATINLVNEAVNQKPPVRHFVFTSSIASYGNSDGKLPLRETSPQKPEDPYGIAKLAAEQDIRAAHEMFGMPFTIFRPHNVYGPRQNIADKFRNVIGIYMNQIMMNESLSIFGDGSQRRGFSYVDDVAPLIAGCVLIPGAANQDYFVGADKDYSVNELAEKVKKFMHSDNEIVYLEKRKEVELAYASHEKLRCHFNPPTETDLDKGLQATAEFVIKQHLFEPTGYSHIEVSRNMPPSWAQWISKGGESIEKNHIHNHAAFHRHIGVRWRENHYLMKEGILPYQRCQSLNPSTGPKNLIAKFSFKGKMYHLVARSVSLWGSSHPDGEPSTLREVEILVYFKEDSSSDCERDSRDRCSIPTTDGLLPMPVTCHYTSHDGAPQKVDGRLNAYQYHGLDGEDQVQEQHRPIAAISCPITDVEMLVANDEFVIDVTLGDDSVAGRVESVLPVDVCYQNIKYISEITVCTQSQHSFNKESKYWFGDPAFSGDHNLIDMFIRYHVDLMGAAVVINDVDGSVLPPLERYLKAQEEQVQQRVFYRTDWLEIAPLADYNSERYDFEAFVQTSCHYEHRLNSHWVAIVHAVDDYLLPLEFGLSLSDVAAQLNIFKVSVAHVPVTYTMRNANLAAQDVNLLQRFSLLDTTDGDILSHGARALGDPRKVSFSLVETLSIYERYWADGQTILNSTDTLKDLQLHVVAIPDLATEDINRDHTFTHDKWLDYLAEQLQILLLDEA